LWETWNSEKHDRIGVDGERAASLTRRTARA
jgi:hypothetical protein